MTSHADASVPLVPHEFPNLLGYLMGPAAWAQTDYTVDLTLLRRLLALGADTVTAIRCHARGGASPEPVLAPDGPRLASHDQRPSTDDAVFGSVRCWRHDFAAPGPDGRCPLAAALNLPVRCAADQLREWAVCGATDAVRAALEAEGYEPTSTATQRQVVPRTVGSDQRNWPCMRSYEYLAWSQPMLRLGQKRGQPPPSHPAAAEVHPGALRGKRLVQQGLSPRRSSWANSQGMSSTRSLILVRVSPMVGLRCERDPTSIFATPQNLTEPRGIP